MLLRLLVTTLIAATVIWAIDADAHGKHGWVMENKETSWCCGPQDCVQLRRKAVHRTMHGWRFIFNGTMHEARDGLKGVYSSPDENFHACFMTPAKLKLRCFFRPTVGF